MRGETFVTRKITRALPRIILGMEDYLYVGNINALRDWGHAKDYVRMMWLMLQQDALEDFVIVSGEQHSVRECIEISVKMLSLTLSWKGEGVDEVGMVESFDETTSTLDGAAEAAIQKTILSLRENLTIVIVAHRLSTVEGCEKVYMLHEGALKTMDDESRVLEEYKKFLKMCSVRLC